MDACVGMCMDTCIDMCADLWTDMRTKIVFFFLARLPAMAQFASLIVYVAMTYVVMASIVMAAMSQFASLIVRAALCLDVCTHLV